MAATDEAGPVRVRTAESSDVARTLEVEVDAARVDAAYDAAYREISKRAKVRGFRPGRVPRAVLERLYGAGVGEEVERILVSETLGEAVEQSGLSLVSEPRVETKPPAPGSPFQYTARVEVKPEIALPDTRGLPVKPPMPLNIHNPRICDHPGIQIVIQKIPRSPYKSE